MATGERVTGERQVGDLVQHGREGAPCTGSASSGRGVAGLVGAAWGGCSDRRLDVRGHFGSRRGGRLLLFQLLRLVAKNRPRYPLDAKSSAMRPMQQSSPLSAPVFHSYISRACLSSQRSRSRSGCACPPAPRHTNPFPIDRKHQVSEHAREKCRRRPLPPAESKAPERPPHSTQRAAAALTLSCQRMFLPSASATPVTVLLLRSLTVCSFVRGSYPVTITGYHCSASGRLARQHRMLALSRAASADNRPSRSGCNQGQGRGLTP